MSDAVAEEEYYEEGYDEAYEEEAYEEGYEEEGYDEEAGHDPNSPEQWEAVALYDFNPENDGELQFTAGTKITVLTAVAKDGWYSAMIDGVTGYVPENYVGSPDSARGGDDDGDAEPGISDKKARRQKLFAERKAIKAEIDCKRATRMSLEEKVAYLEKSNLEKKALMKRVGKPCDSKNFVLYDLIALSIGLEALSKEQDVYQELSGGMMLGLASVQGQLAKDIKPPNPLCEVKANLDACIEDGKKVYTHSGELLSALIACRKEFQLLLEKQRVDVSKELSE